MRLIQYRDADGSDRVGAVDGDRVIDLTGDDGPATVHGIYYDCGGVAEGFETALSRLVDKAPGASLLLCELLSCREGDGGPYLLKPASGPADDPHTLRIWLAGVTHEDSARLREIEAKQATGDQVNVYEQKYRECAAGGRPELFAKGDPDSVVGHGQTLTRPPGHSSGSFPRPSWSACTASTGAASSSVSDTPAATTPPTTASRRPIP